MSGPSAAPSVTTPHLAEEAAARVIHDVTPATLVARLREVVPPLVRAIVPDLAEFAVSVVDHCELPPPLQCHLNDGGAISMGWTVPHFETLIGTFRGDLVDVDEPCVGFVSMGANRLEAMAEWQPSELLRAFYDGIEALDAIVIPTALHEIAHQVDMLLGGRLDPAKRPDPATFWRLARAVTSAGAARWMEHRPAFLRIAAHLEHRARSVNADLRRGPNIVTAADLFGLRPWSTYVDALGDELVELQGESFAAIARRPPPAAFAAAWRRDVEHWISQRPWFTAAHTIDVGRLIHETEYPDVAAIARTIDEEAAKRRHELPQPGR